MAYLRRRRVAAAAIGLVALIAEDEQQQQQQVVPRRMRRMWVHPILRERDEQHVWRNLTLRMRQDFLQLYFRTFRFSTEHFDTLLTLLRPFISKQDTVFRQAIPAEMRLSITLLYLATGDSLTTLSLLFRMGKFKSSLSRVEY